MVAFWLLMALLAAGAIAYIVRYRLLTSALRGMAAANGWSYRYAVYPTFSRQLSGPPFDEAGRRSVRHLIEGSLDGHSFRAFDYWVTMGQFSDHFGIVTTPLAGSLPLICIDSRHTTLGHATGPLTSSSEVATESEELNRRVRITTVDPRAASYVLAPQVVAFLLDHADTLTHVRFSGTSAVSVGHPIARSEDVTERIEALVKLVEEIPSFVWQDRPQGNPPAGAGR